MNAAVAEGYLEALGCSSTWVTSGAEAVACAAAERFDLILHGSQHARHGRLRDDGADSTPREPSAECRRRHRVPIVALTASRRESLPRQMPSRRYRRHHEQAVHARASVDVCWTKSGQPAERPRCGLRLPAAPRLRSISPESLASVDPGAVRAALRQLGAGKQADLYLKLVRLFDASSTHALDASSRAALEQDDLNARPRRSVTARVGRRQRRARSRTRNAFEDLERHALAGERAARVRLCRMLRARTCRCSKPCRRQCLLSDRMSHETAEETARDHRRRRGSRARAARRGGRRCRARVPRVRGRRRGARRGARCTTRRSCCSTSTCRCSTATRSRRRLRGRSSLQHRADRHRHRPSGFGCSAPRVRSRRHGFHLEARQLGVAAAPARVHSAQRRRGGAHRAARLLRHADRVAEPAALRRSARARCSPRRNAGRGVRRRRLSRLEQLQARQRHLRPLRRRRGAAHRREPSQRRRCRIARTTVPARWWRVSAATSSSSRRVTRKLATSDST